MDDADGDADTNANKKKLINNSKDLGCSLWHIYVTDYAFLCIQKIHGHLRS